MVDRRLDDRGVARLWAAVIVQAVEDLGSSNGVEADAHRWLLDPGGAEAVLIGLGWHPRRTREALTAVLRDGSGDTSAAWL